MHKSRRYIFWVTVGIFVLFLSRDSMANLLPMPNLKGQFKKGSLTNTSQSTLQADQVSYSAADNKAHAQGNVVVNSKDQHLTCDQLQMDRAIQEVEAEGNVYLDTPQEQVIAQGLTYNLDDSTGEFRNATVYVDPYRVTGKKIDKISDNHMSVDEGFLTTCDLDEPHYRMQARRMDIYLKDKAIIRKMKIYIGKVPVMYMPYYVQNLKNRPILTFIPGEKKQFGMFLLTTARFQTGDHVKVALHMDMRERTGFGEGADVNYNTPNFGRGLVSVYYTNENLIASNHLWDLYRNGVKVGPTNHHTMYRIVWRHKWQIDKNTNLVLQYYKLHDYDVLNSYFLKNYFPRDYQQNAQNSNYDSYLLLTRNMPHGTITFNIDTSRQNPQLRGVERIPEIQYTFNNQQIGNSGFYAKSTDTYSDLTYQNNPKTFNDKTQRFDSNNDISHPFKIGFISFNPHAGGEETYYSRTAVDNYDNVIRGMFRTSMDMTTKFYKIYDVNTNFAGLNINGLRHVITPSITYLYQAKPTVPVANLDQFDAIDDQYRIHQIEMGLENKLQTKRNGAAVDLMRFLVTTNYGLKGNTIGEPETTTMGTQTTNLATSRMGFNPYDSLFEFYPTNWLTFHNDNEYDFREGHWNSENFDGEIHGQGWAFALGDRYTRYEGNQVTTEEDYTINPKWKFRIFNTYPLVKAMNGNITSARENEYVLTRDLHEWEMDLTIDQQQGQGTAFYVIFRLKASPGMKFNLVNTSFAPSKPGAQAGSEGI